MKNKVKYVSGLYTIELELFNYASFVVNFDIECDKDYTDMSYEESCKYWFTTHFGDNDVSEECSDFIKNSTNFSMFSEKSRYLFFNPVEQYEIEVEEDNDKEMLFKYIVLGQPSNDTLLAGACETGEEIISLKTSSSWDELQKEFVKFMLENKSEVNE